MRSDASDMAAMRRVRMDIFGCLRLISLRALTLDSNLPSNIVTPCIKFAYKTLGLWLAISFCNARSEIHATSDDALVQLITDQQ